MNSKFKGTIIAIGAAATLATSGAAIAGAADGSRDDDGRDRAITGSALAHASKVALKHTGGGRVTGSEIDDEEGYYEIEVTRGGRETDVHLDRAFHVLNSEDDGAGEDDNAGDG